MPHRVQDGAAAQAGAANSLQRLHDLALLDAQRPRNIGAGLKILEALMNVPGFRPRTGGRA